MAQDRVEFDVLANDKASQKLDKIANAFDDMGDKAKAASNKAGEGLGKVGGKLTDGLGKAFKAGPAMALGAGVAVGAVLVGGITAALDKNAVQAKLGAQLGLAGKDADKYGKAAADIYKDGWGESIQETANITKAAFENGLVSINSSRDAIRAVGGQVAVYAELTGTDAVESTRAVANMIKNGLAKNATEAFDILTRGQQLGINKSEDLLDTFNEYSPQFKKMGLSATDSLGLMNQMIQGGARDSDTAADAIKEFAIRAIDGSKSTSAGFKLMGLDAGKMAAEIAKGGPSARTAFGNILDSLNGIKDPVKKNTAGVALFGTKWEDLGASVGKADLDTAAASLGTVAGATQKVNDALGATPSAKLDVLKRKLEQTFVDVFVKHALPAVTKFADWMNGPGLYVMSGWALAGTEAVLSFADKFLGGLDVMLEAAQNWGKWTLRSMAATFAVFNPGLAKAMLDASNDIDGWAKDSRGSIDTARAKLKEWNTDVGKLKTEVKLKADIADMEAKLKTAKKQLEDKSLTKERRAQLRATITDLEAKLRTAKQKLVDPALVATKVAKLQANKTDLDNKIAAAKKALAAPGLTATKRAQLQANITQLLAAKKQAQNAINALTGKTVNVVMNTYKNLIETTIPGGSGVRLPGRAAGGPVSARSTYVVGEKGPEILTMGSSGGNITPNHKIGAAASGMGGGSPQPLVVQLVLDGHVIHQSLLKVKRNTGFDLGLE